MDKILRESQLNPFPLLFMAKQPATPAIASMLLVAGLERSGIHVHVTVFPCEIWVMGRRQLPWFLRTRQGHGGGGWVLPALACHMCGLFLACFWRVFGCRETEWPALGGAGGADCTAGQDVMVLPDPCPRRQRLIQECAPHGPLSSFGTKLQVLWTWGPQWHSAVQTSSHCPAPLANTESKMKFSEGPQVTAIDLSRNKAEANARSVPSLWATAASHTATGFLLRQVCFGRVNSISGALQGSWSKS